MAGRYPGAHPRSHLVSTPPSFRLVKRCCSCWTLLVQQRDLTHSSLRLRVPLSPRCALAGADQKRQTIAKWHIAVPECVAKRLARAALGRTTIMICALGCGEKAQAGRCARWRGLGVVRGPHPGAFMHHVCWLISRGEQLRGNGTELVSRQPVRCPCHCN